MTRAYLAFTEKGLALAQKLAGALPGTVDRCGHGGPGLADWAAEQFAHADALIFVGAVGIAVRAIAPHGEDVILIYGKRRRAEAWRRLLLF